MSGERQSYSNIQQDTGVASVLRLPNNQLAVGTMGGEIRFYDYASGTMTKSLKGHTGRVRKMHVLKDQRRIVSASYDQSLKIWDIASGSCVQTITGHSGEVWSVVELPDGGLATGSSDDTIKIWPKGYNNADGTSALPSSPLVRSLPPFLYPCPPGLSSG